MAKYWRAAVVALAPLCVYAIPHRLLFDESHTICLFHNLTGRDCWGCGILRAITSVAHLNFTEAWNYHKAVVIIVPLLIYLWIKWIFRLVKTAK